MKTLNPLISESKALFYLMYYSFKEDCCNRTGLYIKWGTINQDYSKNFEIKCINCGFTYHKGK